MNLSNAFRKFVLMLALVLALGVAPSAFARSHYSISVGGPGYGISYSDWGHRGGHWGGYVYSPSYYSSYYAPAYYGGYYGPGYYDYYTPSYSSYYYYDRPVVHRTYRTYRHYDHDGYYDDRRDRHDRRYDRDDHYRDRYYDRDRNYGH